MRPRTSRGRRCVSPVRLWESGFYAALCSSCCCLVSSVAAGRGDSSSSAAAGVAGSHGPCNPRSSVAVRKQRDLSTLLVLPLAPRANNEVTFIADHPTSGRSTSCKSYGAIAIAVSTATLFWILVPKDSPIDKFPPFSAEEMERASTINRIIAPSTSVASHFHSRSTEEEWRQPSISPWETPRIWLAPERFRRHEMCGRSSLFLPACVLSSIDGYVPGMLHGHFFDKERRSPPSSSSGASPTHLLGAQRRRCRSGCLVKIGFVIIGGSRRGERVV